MGEKRVIQSMMMGISSINGKQKMINIQNKKTNTIQGLFMKEINKSKKKIIIKEEI